MIGLLLMVALGGFSQVHSSAELRSFESSPLLIERIPSSPWRRFNKGHVLGEVLEVDGQQFQVKTSSRGTYITRTPDATPSVKLSSGKVVQLSWDREEVRRKLELLFKLDSQERWVFCARNARIFTIEETTLCLMDANVDGKFDLLEDAWSSAPGTAIQGIEAELALGANQVEIVELASDGSSLKALVQPLVGTPPQLDALIEINHLRQGEGLPALKLNQELSSACSAHARYLLANKWDGESDPGDQDPRALGGSREGLLAARNSKILALPPREAVIKLWSNLSGRLALISPSLREVGLSEIDAQVSVIDISSPATQRTQSRHGLSRVVLSPAPGAVDQPTAYFQLRGSMPTGVAMTGGPPILMCWQDPDAEILSYSAKLRRGGPRGAVTPLRELKTENEARGIRGFLPLRPLASGASYHVTHEVLVDGVKHEFEASFRTR